MTTVLHLATTPISLDWLLAPQLEALRSHGYRVVTASAPGARAQGLADRSISHHSLPAFTREVDWQSDLRAVSQLGKLIQEVQPDIIHTHNPKPGVLGRIVGKWSGVPIVVNTVHGLYAQPTDSFARKAVVYGVERMAAAHSDAELVQSLEDVKTLRSLGVPDGRLYYLGNGIDLGEFSPSPIRARAGRCLRVKLGISSATPVLGVVGRLVWGKGFAELFGAVEQLRRSYSTTELAVVVVGPHESSKADGIDQRTIEDVARRLGIHFLGERRDIPEVLSSFDIFALPSHREGFPRAAMEASAMGVPVVASDIRGCREVVDHEVTGLLVDSRNPSELAASIARLVEEPGLGSSLGRRARSKALNEFDQRSVIGLTLAVYRSLLQQRGLPVPDQPVADVRPWYVDSIDLVDREASNRARA